MRLGEIKKIVDKVIDENKKLVIKNNPIFGDQAYVVENYGDVFSALEVLDKQNWNDLDFSPIEQLSKKYSKKRNSRQLTKEEFDQLNSYVSSLNQKLPYFYSIIDGVVEDQDEKIINIKLPEKINSLSGLSQVNKRLEKIFKIFALDGQFELVGFDKGSEWYVVISVGFLSYQSILHGLNIAKRFFETKESYYKSKKARLDYEASLKKGEKFDEKAFTEYCERRLDLTVKVEVEESTKKIEETNGKTQEELQTHMIQGVKELVKELGEGTEFHLSLNPPDYLVGNIGNLQIDYEKIQQIRAKEAEKIGANKPKELSEPEEIKTSKDNPNKEK